MQSKATTVAAYRDELPEDRRAALSILRTMIREAVPDASEGVRYGMANFEQGDFSIGLASQKAHMAFYLCDADFVENHRGRLGKLNCGKGCIRFRRLADLPLDVVTDILHESVKRPVSSSAAKNA